MLRARQTEEGIKIRTVKKGERVRNGEVRKNEEQEGSEMMDRQNRMNVSIKEQMKLRCKNNYSKLLDSPFFSGDAEGIATRIE
jgi:hypothetical protein